jgi:hypothetical protein
MNFKTLTAFLAFTVLSSNAFAGFLKEGGFLGKQNGEEKVNLLLKSAPGREGSFFAVLMKDAKKISLYLVDEINSNSYAMTPLEVTRDGEIGIVNDDPSLVISSAKGSNGQDVFKIMSANSSNNSGFTGFFEFEGKSSKEINGTFTLREKFPAMYLINQNSVLATGTQKNQIPSAIGIFLEKRGLFGSKSVDMLLVNPKNDTDMKVFSKKQ